MQTRLQSWVEVVCSTALAYTISVFAGQVIYPLFGMQVSVGANIGLTGVFTAISILRSYITRRFFNWLHNRQRHGTQET
jgi:membrane associated rhomboid family serine protease